MEWTLLFLLLPVAALSGWLIGRKGAGVNEQRAYNKLNADYLKGLNYLLNEQSDKAIEVFVQMLEVDSETVETHFALGNLFLRRGEVDRAIRIHQNLMARPTLTQQQRQLALFELGKDYLRAGLLDRAESMLIRATENPELAPLAMPYLLEVYQQEKEWHKAIAVASKWKDRSGFPGMGSMIAHFMCEEAEEAFRTNRHSEARSLLRMAIKEDANSVRATLLEARMEMVRDNYADAIKLLRRIEYQDPGYISETIEAMRECHQRLGSDDELLTYLEALISRELGDSSIALLHAEMIRKFSGTDAAIIALERYFHKNPSLRVMRQLIEWRLQSRVEDAPNDLALLNKLIAERIDKKPAYQCRNCGFNSRTLNWQCPTCKQWNTIKPLLGAEGE